MDKLKCINPGDRVRVTMEGVVNSTMSGDVLVRTDGAKGVTLFEDIEIAAPTFHIERIEPPIAVGDRVRPSEHGGGGTVLAVHDGSAWVSWDRGISAIWSLSSLVLIP